MSFYNYIIYSFCTISMIYFGFLIYKEYSKIVFYYINTIFNIKKEEYTQENKNNYQ